MCVCVHVLGHGAAEGAGAAGWPAGNAPSRPPGHTAKLVTGARIMQQSGCCAGALLAAAPARR